MVGSRVVPTRKWRGPGDGRRGTWRVLGLGGSTGCDTPGSVMRKAPLGTGWGLGESTGVTPPEVSRVVPTRKWRGMTPQRMVPRVTDRVVPTLKWRGFDTPTNGSSRNGLRMVPLVTDWGPLTTKGVPGGVTSPRLYTSYIAHLGSGEVQAPPSVGCGLGTHPEGSQGFQ